MHQAGSGGSEVGEVDEPGHVLLASVARNGGEQGPGSRRARRQARRRRRRHIIGVVAAVLVTAAVATAVGAWAFGSDPPTVAVTTSTGEHEIRIDDPAPLSAVLDRAGLHPPWGPLLSVVSHKVLDPDFVPPAVTVDGRPADLSTIVDEGQAVVITDGHDKVEGTVTKPGPLPARAPPAVWVHLWNPGKPGIGQFEVGEHSGEVVHVTPVVAPTPPSRVTTKQVALTFDDGPSRYTSKVLDILQAKGVKATFCEVGYAVPGRAAIVHQLVDAGMVLCNHTQSHDEQLDEQSAEGIEAQIGGGAQAQVSIGLPPPAFYRPPGGTLSPEIVDNARGVHHEQVLYWTVDPKDWQRPPTDTIVKRVLENTGPGTIILLHDGGGNRSHTVAALPRIIDGLRARGYEFVLPSAIQPNAGPPVAPSVTLPGLEGEGGSGG